MDLSSPIKDIPECWKDEKRMNSLFAPFRKKEMNPIDWESKMKFWRSVIEKWCLEKDRASFSTQTIQKEFKRNGRTPACIATVLEEYLRCGEIRSKSEFLAQDPNQSWTSWAVDSLVKTPGSWFYGKVKNYWAPTETAIQPDSEFVLISYLKERSELLHSKTASNNEDLISFKDIREMLSNDSNRISEDSVNCIVHYLCLEGKAAVQIEGDTKLVKLLRRDKSREITQADLAIFKLQQNKSILEKNIEHLEQEKERVLEEAKAYLKKGMEASAKSCLRKKKSLDKCIEKRTITLDNLESLLSSLRNTESDSQVLDAYKAGLSALKGTFKSSGLSEDGVFETMAQIQEMNDIQDEIQTAMSQPIVSDLGDDLEAELQDIMSKPASKSFDLPDVPSHPVGSPIIENKPKVKYAHPLSS